MWKLRNRYSRIGIVVCLAIGLMGMGTLSQDRALAGQSSRSDLPVVDGETQLFPGYPRDFDGYGMINRIGQKEVVISDSLLSLPSGAGLHTPRSNSASIGRFAMGDYVGYQLDAKGAIKSLWLLQKGKR